MGFGIGVADLARDVHYFKFDPLWIEQEFICSLSVSFFRPGVLFISFLLIASIDEMVEKDCFCIYFKRLIMDRIGYLV